MYVRPYLTEHTDPYADTVAYSSRASVRASMSPCGHDCHSGTSCPSWAHLVGLAHWEAARDLAYGGPNSVVVKQFIDAPEEAERYTREVAALKLAFPG